MDDHTHTDFPLITPEIWMDKIQEARVQNNKFCLKKLIRFYA
jgi:hypothetical protein